MASQRNPVIPREEIARQVNSMEVGALRRALFAYRAFYYYTYTAHANGVRVICCAYCLHYITDFPAAPIFLEKVLSKALRHRCFKSQAFNDRDQYDMS